MKWIRASERLPEVKGYYITKRPTLSKRYIIKEEVFNPKYEDIKEKWISFEYQWLDESQQLQSQPQDIKPFNFEKLHENIVERYKSVEQQEDKITDEQIEQIAEKLYPTPSAPFDKNNFKERIGFIKGLKYKNELYG